MSTFNYSQGKSQTVDQDAQVKKTKKPQKPSNLDKINHRPNERSK